MGNELLIALIGAGSALTGALIGGAAAVVGASEAARSAWLGSLNVTHRTAQREAYAKLLRAAHAYPADAFGVGVGVAGLRQEEEHTAPVEAAVRVGLGIRTELDAADHPAVAGVAGSVLAAWGLVQDLADVVGVFGVFGVFEPHHVRSW